MKTPIKGDVVLIYECASNSKRNGVILQDPVCVYDGMLYTEILCGINKIVYFQKRNGNGLWAWSAKYLTWSDVLKSRKY